MSPWLQIDLTLPNGTALAELAELGPVTYSASTEFCNVRIDGNDFTGNLHDYKIRARSGDLAVDVSLTPQVPSCFPETGNWLY
ncbi:hypothetical protein [Streptomyces sp. NPDC001642]|uniref:hypothetical protein n=1 Tax=Streptomyces sp. NPDC001642 TaxID=3154392 RepID=UPI00331FF975